MTTISNAATTASAALTDRSQPQYQTQILVRLNNEKTHLLKFPNHAKITNDEIITQLSQVTNLPKRMLHLRKPKNNTNTQNNKYTNLIPNFLSAYTFLPILGGKGGFGTLLKGQSKQAGAKQTVDFGACRDLNGRRLRHVNDEIKLRRWRESVQKRAKAGKGVLDVEQEMEYLRTSSGVRNWHLTVPSWGAGEISGKSRYKEERMMRREIEKMSKEQIDLQEKKLAKKREWEKVKVDYASLGQETAKSFDAKFSQSILEGMKKRRKVDSTLVNRNNDMARDDASGGDHEDDVGLFTSLISTDASFLCTLSGDIVVGDDETDEIVPSKTNARQGDANSKPKVTVTMIQSKSEFGTAAILLDPDKLDPNINKGLYYEIIIETEGIAQIGWGRILTSNEGHVRVLPSTGKDSFLPNSDTGDGVGDDAFSYGFDGFRRKVFHDGKEISYSKNDEGGWKKGDVIGCLYNFSNGTVSFSVNGIDLGVAFDNVGGRDSLLYPVFSLNENEIIGMNTGPSFHHCPADFLGISHLINDKNETSSRSDNGVGEMKAGALGEGSTYTATIGSVVLPPTRTSTGANKSAPAVKIPAKAGANDDDQEPIDINSYSTVLEIEFLGMERLKVELYRLGIKCGGSLPERAKRLFSLKGLSRDQIPKKLRGKNF